MAIFDEKLLREDYQELFELLAWLRQHPVIATFMLTGIKLPPHQRIILRFVFEILQDWRVTSSVAIAMGRASGKSFMCFLMSIIIGLLYKEERVAYLNGVGFKGGKKLFSDHEWVLSSSPDYPAFILNALVDRSRPIKRDSGFWMIKFKNGSELYTTSVGLQGDQARGFRSTFRIIDERRLIPQSVVRASLDPFGYVLKNPVSKERVRETNVRLDVSTVGWTHEDFTKEIEEYKKSVEAGDLRRVALEFDYEDAILLYGEHTIEEFVEARPEERSEIGEIFFWFDFKAILNDKNDPLGDIDIWYAEVKNIPISSASMEFDYQLVEKMFNKRVGIINGEEVYLKPLYTTEDPVVIGIDPAREQNYFAFVIVRVGQLAEGEWDPVKQEGHTDFSNIIWISRHLNFMAGDADKMLKEYLERYPNVKLIMVDKRGGGTAFRDELLISKQTPDLIVYDPEDNDKRVKEILSRAGDKEKRPILRLLSTTAPLNLNALLAMKSFLKNDAFYAPSVDNIEFDDDFMKFRDVYRALKVLKAQIYRVKTRQVANGVNFEIEGPGFETAEGVRKKTKDMFMAMLYAVMGVYELVWQATAKTKKKRDVNWSELAQWVKF